MSSGNGIRGLRTNITVSQVNKVRSDSRCNRETSKGFQQKSSAGVICWDLPGKSFPVQERGESGKTGSTLFSDPVGRNGHI